MKIGLISPKGISLSSNSGFRTFWENSNLTGSFRQYWSGLGSGLLILASLTPDDVSVEIVDENCERIDFDRPFDLIGISCMTQQADRAYEIASLFRKNGVKVVIGGIHASVLPEEAKNHCDSVVMGEAEGVWKTLLEDFRNSNLKPFYRSSEPYDISKSPSPRYELLKQKGYKVIWVQTTRGCPHECEFCAASNIYGKKYRYKTVDQIVQELTAIKNLFPDSLIGFGEDNLFVNKKHSIDFLSRIAGLKIRWMSQTDISVAEDDELLSLIKKSGCKHLLIGFESLSKNNLKTLSNNSMKLQKMESYARSIQKIQNHGIGVLGSFIIGFDNDDITTQRQILNFILDNHLYAVQVTILTPFPGTRLRDRMLKEKRVLNTKWENYTAFDVNFIHDNLTKSQMEESVINIYSGFYRTEVFRENMKYFVKVQKNLLAKTE